ncbi:MAG: hypothetical protein B0D92_01345 [Spirochaeta sp. LUC14_002_19_P3]|nr:MAG: hypothetical protein B0D92_01345 [Spirochaeta sp. LUC14_002_19_P3]
MVQKETVSILPGRFQHLPYNSVHEAVKGKPSARIIADDIVWTCKKTDGKSDAKSAEDSKNSWSFQFKVLEDHLDDGPVILRFDNLPSAMDISVNSSEIGCFPADFVPVELNIKPFLKTGGNEIILNEIPASGKSGEQTEPLHLPTKLIVFPPGGFLDISISCQFDGTCLDAQLKVRCILDGGTAVEGEKRTLCWYLYEPGSPDIYASSDPVSVTFDGQHNPSISMNGWIHEPRHWTAESPFLYNIIIEMIDDIGVVKDVRSMAWGFRQFTLLNGLEGGMLMLNNEPATLLGCRQPAPPREMSLKELETGLLLMKRLNMNTLQCSHQPFSEALYQIADRIGLYIFEEITADGGDESTVMEYLKTVIRSRRTHPSIVGWIIRTSPHTEKHLKALKKSSLDSSRLLCIPGSTNAEASDFFFYPPLNTDLAVQPQNTQKIAPPKYQDKPVILRAPANSLRSHFSPYTELARTQKNIAGTIIENLYAENLSFAGAMLTPQHRLTPDAAEIQVQFCPVSIAAIDLEYGKIALSNHLTFNRLFDYEIYWRLQRKGETAASGMIYQPDTGPGESRLTHLFRDLKAFPGRGEGFLTFIVRVKEENTWAKASQSVGRMQIPVPENLKPYQIYKTISERPSEVAAPPPVESVQEEPPHIPWSHKISGSELLAVRGKIGLRFSLNTGLLEAMYLDWRNFFTHGFALCGDNLAKETIPIASSSHKLKNHPDNLELLFKLKSPELTGTAEFRVNLYTDGRIAVFLKAAPVSSRRLILCFGLPSEYKQLIWYGCGPHRVYSSSLMSASVGLHTSTVDEPLPENQSYENIPAYAGVRWLELGDGGHAVRISSPETPIKGRMKTKQLPLSFNCFKAQFPNTGDSAEGENHPQEYIQAVLYGNELSGSTQELKFILLPV